MDLRFSGCLVTFLYYRTIANKRIREKRITKGCHGQVLQFFGMILYRYFRLTPVYLLVIGLVQVSMKWYHDHSMIELPTALDYEACEKFWWRNALYINTYFSTVDRVSVTQYDLKRQSICLSDYLKDRKIEFRIFRIDNTFRIDYSI